MGDSKIYNVGIIGWGLSAQVFHIPYISMVDRLKLVGGVTSKKGAIKAPLKHYSSAVELISDEGIDLVIVATPPHTHFDLVSAALQKGKHVVCEKPFVPKSEQADKLAALAKDMKKVLAIYQNRRWDSDFLTVKKLFEEKKLGRVYEFESHFDRYRPTPSKSSWKNDLGWDQAGGPLYDLGTHLMDQTISLFGKPDEVWGRFLCQRGQGNQVVDSITAILSYQRRLDVIIRIGAVSCEKKQLRYWIRGTEGSFKKWGLDPQEDQLKAGTDDVKENIWKREDFGIENPENVGLLCTADEDGNIKEEIYETVKPETYKGFYIGLVEAMESGKAEDIPVKAEEASLVLKIIEGLRKSVSEGVRVKI